MLAASPSVAVIAESGQKHTIFRARVGWWQFEEHTLRPFAPELERLLGLVEQLYAGGFSKADIETGRYPQHRVVAFGVRQWHELEAGIRPERGTPRLQLALFLAQKENDDDGRYQPSGGAAASGATHDAREPDQAGFLF